MLDDVAQAVGLSLKPGLDLVLVGETQGWLGQSLWLREIAGPGGRRAAAGRPGGRAPQRRCGARLDPAGRWSPPATTCSDGGLLVAVAEMAMAGGTGATLAAGPAGLPAHGCWFGEDQARYLLAVPDGAALLAAAQAAGVRRTRIGRSGGEALVLPGGPVHIRREPGGGA